MPSHPLVSLMRRFIEEPGDAAELERAVASLRAHGWNQEELQKALSEALSVAGRAAVDAAPYLIVGDANPPDVAIRLPIAAEPIQAAKLSSKLRDRLAELHLLRPGMSLAFRSTAAVRPTLRRAA